MTRTEAPPLAGVRVLDLTRLLPGPVCSLYLADLGADVVKIEDTGAGDYARTLGTSAGRVSTAGPPQGANRVPFRGVGVRASAFYRAVNRNKRSLAIDLKNARGRDAFARLARTADVVVESFRPGVVASLGVGYEALSADHPRLVYASISGYGQHGPRAQLAGHDINYLGYAGVLDQTGAAGGAPALCNLQIADLLGGAASAAIAILAALFAAQRSGRGRYIDVAMADAALAHNIFPLQALEQWGAVAARGEDLLTGGVPCYGVYPTQDGRWLAVGALEEKFWCALCEALGRHDLIAGGLATGERGRRIRAELVAIFGTRPLAHWIERFSRIDCCVTPVLTLDEAVNDVQFAAREMVVESDGTRQYAPPFKMAGVPFSIARTAPAHGEHSVEVLREAGLDAHEIDALVATGVVRT